MKIKSETCVKDYSYLCELDEQGYYEFNTEPLFGYLKVIKFRIPRENNNISPFKVMMDLEDYEIFSEDINNDEWYILKIQPKTGFGEHWSMSNEFYLFNGEVINCLIKGSANNQILITYRVEEV